MAFQQHIPFLSIFISLIVAILIPLLKDKKIARTLTLVSVSSIIVLSITLIIYLYNYDIGYFTYQLGHFPAPWGNELRTGL